ncbi:MAG: GTPase ObgE [Treponema sp. CETP13]|nr:MAG: GTPase ObgE [Treponema sp. CETP13]
MIQFADEATIEVYSGKGGNGCVAWRREKYIPLGGPAGGDGGRGGDVIFRVRRNLRTLAHLRHHPVFKAKSGGGGEGHERYGHNGEDVVINVPPGTALRDFETRELIKEFTNESEDEEFVFLTGGKGGWGNIHFKNSINQAPEIAYEGKPGEYRKLRVELSIMADIGLVGFPNAGKSSLLDFFTNARPQIAPYPFTTKIPNLGVLRADEERDIIIADIPGIIEGASDGVGLGFRFLKHISRTAGLVFIIDCADENYLTAYEKLSEELAAFSDELAKKPRIILCNKIDQEEAVIHAAELVQKYKDMIVIPMSIYNREGLDKVRKTLLDLVTRLENGKDLGSGMITGGTFTKPVKSDFMATRAAIDDDERTQYPGSEN